MFLKQNKINFLFILIMCLLFFVGSADDIDRKTKDKTYEELSLFADALSIIQTQYVDDIKPKDLVYGALKGLFSSLDPYSEFLTAQEYQELKSNTEGRFGGIGMEITLKDGLVVVVSPLKNTPAWKAGVKTGDIIVKIDDKIIKGYSLTDAVRALRGDPDSEVKLTIWRQGEVNLLELKIVRAMIKIDDIQDVRIVEPGIGYVRLVEFSEETPRDLTIALDELMKKDMKGLVLDVRNNPGGLLSVAAEVAEIFLDKDEIIVTTRGRDNSQNTFEFRSKRNSIYDDLLMIVLINEGSASGSEILAGALKDHKRALIVGQKTFGKGSVQSIIPLSDGSAVKLTTSKYFTPSGRSIPDEGIEPDIDIEFMLIQRAQEQAANIPEEVAKTLGLKDDTDLFMKRYQTDSQLLRAVDVLEGLLIFNENNTN